MERTDKIGHKIVDHENNEWVIVDEYIWNIDIEVFDQIERGVDCRYIAVVDLLACKMQLAENRRYHMDKNFMAGIVPKLSPHHLKAIAPGHDIELFGKLEKEGITSDAEYERLMDTGSSDKPRDVKGCWRYCINSYQVLSDMADVKCEVKNFGPVYGSLVVYKSMAVMEKTDSYYRPSCSTEKVGWERAVTVVGVGDKTERVAQETLRHAVTIVGLGRCVRENKEEEYFIVQNTYGTKRKPVRGRVNFRCVNFAISPALVEDEE